MENSSHGAAYTRRLMLAIGLYMFTLFGGNWLLAMVGDAFYHRVLISLLPLIPMMLMLRAIILFVRQLDEMQRRIIMEAQMIATVIVGFGSFAYGFLEQGAGLPKLSTYAFMPALFAVYGVAAFFVSKRYQ